MIRRNREITERAADWDAANRDANDPRLAPAERAAARQAARDQEQQLRGLFDLPLRTN